MFLQCCCYGLVNQVALFLYHLSHEHLVYNTNIIAVYVNLLQLPFFPSQLFILLVKYHDMITLTTGWFQGEKGNHFNKCNVYVYYHLPCIIFGTQSILIFRKEYKNAYILLYVLQGIFKLLGVTIEIYIYIFVYLCYYCIYS